MGYYCCPKKTRWGALAHGPSSSLSNGYVKKSYVFSDFDTFTEQSGVRVVRKKVLDVLFVWSFLSVHMWSKLFVAIWRKCALDDDERPATLSKFTPKNRKSDPLSNIISSVVARYSFTVIEWIAKGLEHALYSRNLLCHVQVPNFNFNLWCSNRYPWLVGHFKEVAPWIVVRITAHVLEIPA
jgi:hypothetical protein